MNDDIEKQIELHIASAIAFARKYNIELDYSNKSIEGVETILADLHDEQKKFNVPDTIIGQVATAFGAYIGTTLIKNLQKGQWKLDQDILFVQIEDGAIFFPAKVYRRIRDGEQDNVTALYVSTYNQYASSPIHLGSF